ncbi:ATP-binding protein [Candidatus Agathobaculum pullicola]|uniref:ATP-binding protein n=1 Tax=Candidatus Agathobaculum pullicola TaxID=2838426 RepID=UPI003F931313
MRLSVMADTLSTQLADSQYQTLPFEDPLTMWVDAEWSTRKSNRLPRLIRNAGYADPAACVENIEYLLERKLDREQILRLASCAYLHEAHNIIILGPPGPARPISPVRLVWPSAVAFTLCDTSRLTNLLVDISVVWANGTNRNYMKKLQKEKLLILTNGCFTPSRRRKPVMYWNW